MILTILIITPGIIASCIYRILNKTTKNSTPMIIQWLIFSFLIFIIAISFTPTITTINIISGNITDLVITLETEELTISGLKEILYKANDTMTYVISSLFMLLKKSCLISLISSVALPGIIVFCKYYLIDFKERFWTKKKYSDKQKGFFD